MKTHHISNIPFTSLNVAVLTISDTRDEANDSAGQLLVEMLTDSGHTIADKRIVKDDVYQLRAAVSQWIASSSIQVVLTTGGTGFSDRDITPEALTPLFDKKIDGFGELFRRASFSDIGTSTLQSRAFAGMANNTLLACMPGSPNACRTAWEKVLKDQLDHSHRPCNFAEHLVSGDDSVTNAPVTACCNHRS